MTSSSQMWKVTLFAVFLFPSCLGKLRTAAHHCLNYRISHARSPAPVLIRRHQSGSLYQLANHVRRYRGGVSERDVGFRVRRQSQHPLEREERPGVLSRPGLQRSTQSRGPHLWTSWREEDNCKRFKWKDVVEDVKNIVSNSVHMHNYEVSPVRCCEFCGHAGFYV